MLDGTRVAAWTAKLHVYPLFLGAMILAACPQTAVARVAAALQALQALRTRVDWQHVSHIGAATPARSMPRAALVVCSLSLHHPVSCSRQAQPYGISRFPLEATQACAFARVHAPSLPLA